jgi:hypothetical protein
VPTKSASPLLKEKSPNDSRLKYSDPIEEAEMMFHATVNSSYHSLLDEPQLMDCFLLHPVFDDEDRYPLDYRTIRAYQAQDQLLTAAVATQPKLIMKQLSENLELICFSASEGVAPDDWKIAIPDAMLDKLVNWYHLSLTHVGMTRLKSTMEKHFYHPKLNERIRQIVGKCDSCQKNKSGSRAYADLPPRHAIVAPWHEIHIDLIGPWRFRVQGIELHFNALTIIDPVTFAAFGNCFDLNLMVVTGSDFGRCKGIVIISILSILEHQIEEKFGSECIWSDSIKRHCIDHGTRNVGEFDRLVGKT